MNQFAKETHEEQLNKNIVESKQIPRLHQHSPITTATVSPPQPPFVVIAIPLSRIILTLSEPVLALC